MEDNKNKPAGGGAARDISDLKARLGLRKSAPGVPAPGPGAPVPSPPGVTPPFASQPVQSAPGSVPPPAGIPAPIPPPPGFQPPVAAPASEPAPAPVDPRRDPFGAAQAPMPPAAYYGYAPLPGVDDGKPAEEINKPKPWGRIGIVGVAVLATFGMGFGCGAIHWIRGNMNRTIDQAAEIKTEVDSMAKTLNAVADIVAATPENAKMSPADMAEKLGQLDLKAPERDKKLFKTNYFFMNDLAIDRLFNYYNDTVILYSAIGQHVKKTQNDKAAIESYMKSQGGGAGGGQRNYAVSLDASGPLLLANFAERGSSVCQNGQDTDCSADQIKGFKYRTEPGGQWYEKPVKGTPTQVIIPIRPSALLNQLAKASPDELAFESAQRRLLEIRLLIAKLAGEQKELQGQLTKESDTSRKQREYVIF